MKSSILYRGRDSQGGMDRWETCSFFPFTTQCNWCYYRTSTYDRCQRPVRVLSLWGHPLEGFCQAKKILLSKKSQIFCIIKQNNSIV